MYKSIFYSIILLAIALCLNCGTGAETENQQSWKEIGLQDIEIFALEYVEGYLFTGTKYGIYRTNTSDRDLEWEEPILKINPDTSVVGDILYDGQTLFQVVRNTIDFEKVPENYTTLYRSSNFGSDWEAMDIQLEGRERPYILNRLAKAKDNPDLFADWHLIFKSTDHGEIWENLTDSSRVGVSEFLYVSEEYPEQIWTGGWTNIFTPYLAKSEDGGKNWVHLNDNFFDVDGYVYTMIISPKEIATVLIGVGAQIKKSKDGGTSWHTVLEGYNIRAIENSTKNEERVFASGIDPGTEKLFVAISDNYGDTWRVEKYEQSPEGIYTNEIIVTEIDGNETVFFATNNGVYSLIFEE